MKHTTQPLQPELPFDEIEYGYCHCGCGQKTRLAPQTIRTKGIYKGQPQRFIKSHHARLQPVRPPAERFWEKVDKRGPDECWEWQASTRRHGYGQFWNGNRLQEAHRYSWELHNGPIPDNETHHGICVLHRCDNPKCVNPAHLFLGTQAENMADMITKGRVSRGEKQGHAKLTEAEVIEIRLMFSDGIRQVDIARQFNVSYNCIYHVVHRHTWQHLP